MKLTVLTLDEHPRLEWRKVLTDYYRKTGDWMVYSLFPCIIISEGDAFEERICIGDGAFSFSKAPVWNGSCSVLPLKDGSDPLPGLFISMGEAKPYPFPEIRTTAGGIALVEADGGAFRILRSRHLRKGTAF